MSKKLIQPGLEDIAIRIAQEFKSVREEIGSLPTLKTSDKTSIVNAINELIVGVSTYSNPINDLDTNYNQTWSSAYINTKLGQLQTLINNSGTDLTSITNKITKLTADLNNKLSINELQGLTLEQKNYGITNLGAAKNDLTNVSILDANVDAVHQALKISKNFLEKLPNSEHFTTELKSDLITNKNKRVTNFTITGDTNKVATITFQDGTTLVANFVDIDTDTDIKFNSISFDKDTGVITVTTTDNIQVTCSMDGRYSLLGHTHPFSQITDFPEGKYINTTGDTFPTENLYPGKLHVKFSTDPTTSNLIGETYIYNGSDWVSSGGGGSSSGGGTSRKVTVVTQEYPFEINKDNQEDIFYFRYGYPQHVGNREITFNSNIDNSKLVDTPIDIRIDPIFSIDRFWIDFTGISPTLNSLYVIDTSLNLKLSKKSDEDIYIVTYDSVIDWDERSEYTDIDYSSFTYLTTDNVTGIGECVKLVNHPHLPYIFHDPISYKVDVDKENILIEFNKDTYSDFYINKSLGNNTNGFNNLKEFIDSVKSDLNTAMSAKVHPFQVDYNQPVISTYQNIDFFNYQLRVDITDPSINTVSIWKNDSGTPVKLIDSVSDGDILHINSSDYGITVTVERNGIPYFDLLDLFNTTYNTP